MIEAPEIEAGGHDHVVGDVVRIGKGKEFVFSDIVGRMVNLRVADIQPIQTARSMILQASVVLMERFLALCLIRKEPIMVGNYRTGHNWDERQILVMEG